MLGNESSFSQRQFRAFPVQGNLRASGLFLSCSVRLGIMYVEPRKRLVSWLCNQLIGPPAENSMKVSPLDRFPTGVLHPIVDEMQGIDPASAAHEVEDLSLQEEQDDEVGEDGDAEDQTFARSVRRRRYVPPSSVGFSFFARGDVRLSITACAAIYKNEDVGNGTGYKREELGEECVAWPGSVPVGDSVVDIFQGRACIDVRTRAHGDGTILTVTLCNRRKVGADVPQNRRKRERVGNALFETRFECRIENGELVEYPRVDASMLTEEEQELELQYREQHIFAIGHGAAANWDAKPGQLPRIWSEFMPEAEVSLMTVNIGNDNAALSLKNLASAVSPDDLERFVDGYAEWICEQKSIGSGLATPDQKKTAARICERMEVAQCRMRESIRMLRTDPLAVESFQLANQAMQDQMRQADLASGKEARPCEDYKWRPFQLAFLLTVMVSTIRDEDKFRDALDLIWFPTGGGKTEAYLGLIAFLIVWRRLKYPDTGDGTCVLMRYTLRLLTRQQFARAARMICALELIRRGSPERLGSSPIEIGIWVGGEVSPNSNVKANEIVSKIRSGQSDARYELLLERCPWCNTQFDAVDSYVVEDERFQFRCSNHTCAFTANSLPLPCNTVDETLYDQPPSLLIGTIDKFARLAWEERTGAFFGVRTGSRPPELIIQDELHLITGPLGSVAGLYEAGLDTLLVHRGVRPKYVASTATIRMAKEQVKRLFARDLAVFPPPGLSHDDSYFARSDKERPGRLYVGFLAPMLDQRHCLGPLAATLLAGPQELFGEDTDRDALLDAWWTQVIYHGSLRNLGNSHNAFYTDVRDFGRWLVNTRRNARGDNSADDHVRFQNPRIAQLTSRRNPKENAETFQRLGNSRCDESCLDAVLATNMVSVGLDVARLALMIVVGQPLTTAEYIQATSRVGRADVPGLVVVDFFRHQARSLSHYESFRPYHEAFSRFVEPSSVTPQTLAVRSRALHAALVIAIRHALEDLHDNNLAGKFDRDSGQVKAVIDKFKRRCKMAETEESRHQATLVHINRLRDEWHDEARRCEREKRRLCYAAKDKNSDRLLYSRGESRPGLWPTLNSMRNVEGTGALKIRDWPPNAPGAGSN